MEVAGIHAARWVLSKALGPLSSGLLEAWAASYELGTNVEDLKLEMLYAQGMLNNARSRGPHQEIQNPALTELLLKLRGLADRADDVLDELEYFRIQDELYDTFHAADEHDGGGLKNHALNARHTAKAVVKMLGCSKGSPTTRHKGPTSEEDTSRGVSCGALACLGPKSPVDDDEEEEPRRGVRRCGAIWPCGKASAMPPVPQANQLQGNKEAAGHAGCISKLASTAIHAVGKHIPCQSASPVQRDNNSNITAPSSGCAFLSCGRPNKAAATQTKRIVQTPKLDFNRVEMSQKMKEITDQLKHVCVKVSTILNLELLDSNHGVAQYISLALHAKFSNNQCPAPPLHINAVNRPMTNPDFIEPNFQGRGREIREIIDIITEGTSSGKDLTVFPIVGPGGLGKTTLTQKIYNSEELQNLFDVKLWVCVSINFSVHRLTQEIADQLRTNEPKDTPPDKLIAEKVNNKRFLLVLDDMWDCTNQDVWERFLVPFKNGHTKGSVILVTTRIPQLAQMVKTTEKWMDLESLDREAFDKLFLACIFGNEQPSNDHSGLLEIGNQIKEKLKGSPLAAKTVGRLLRKHIDLDHWTRVLESKEWESQNDENDIMPALKLSFDYLPFHLKQCYIYCALFPEDYRFDRQELIHLWIGLDVLHSPNGNKSIEDIGHSNLTELVGHGFFKEENDELGRTFYIIHDLLHNLALKVSAQECLSICSSHVRSAEIPPSLRHLSIHIDDSSVKDQKTFDSYKEDFNAFEKRLKVENLRSLLLFGSYQCSFASTIGSLLSNAKALRVIFLKTATRNMEHLLRKDSNHVHLRYFRTLDGWGSGLPNNITRYYHLRVLDVLGHGSSLPRDMCNLIKLRHFVVRYDREKLHSEISDVGKLKYLQALDIFVVKKESQGFELREIGHLQELRGSLHIKNLDKVESREEAEEAKLMRKKYLHKLTLDWSTDESSKDPACKEQVIEGLKPNSNLSELFIIGHRGITCPSWLGLYLKDLKSLGIHNVAWEKFPSVGKFWLVNENFSSDDISNQIFHNLKRIELVKLEGVKKWVVDSTCQFHSCLEVLIIKDCSELMELSFSNSTCRQQEQNILFPKLRELEIERCSKLSSLPPVPWNCALCEIRITDAGLGFERLEYSKEDGFSLRITGRMVAPDTNEFWMALRFDNLTKVKMLDMVRCPPLPLDALKMLSLKKLIMSNPMNAIWSVEEGRPAQFQLPVERLVIKDCEATAKELNQILSYMPKLVDLAVFECDKITGLGVVEQQNEATNRLDGQSSTTSSSLHNNSTEEEEIAEEGLLLLPSQLQTLKISNCPEIRLGPDDGSVGLHGLCSLRSLEISGCPKFLSSTSASSSSCSPFPTSLQSLFLWNQSLTIKPAADCVEAGKTVSLANLSSLTTLSISGCEGGEGLWRHLPRGRLTRLTVQRTSNFFLIDPEPSSQLQQEHGLSFPFPVLHSVETDDAFGFLATPVCRLLASSLTELFLGNNEEIDQFRTEQEAALQLLVCLQKLTFLYYPKLQRLPAGLRGLSNLKRLEISSCAEIHSLPTGGFPDSLRELWIQRLPIRSLPTGGFPDSLQTLVIASCESLRSLPKDSLPTSLQELKIFGCRHLRKLPKDGLPRSLRLLDVQFRTSEDLKSHCRKLIGTIPIVKV